MPYTYRWNDEQSEASLVEADGAEQTFEIIDPMTAGGLRKQTWRFSGRAECQRCHNKWSGPALAFNLPQLWRDHAYAAGTASPLATLAHISLIDEPVDANQKTKLVDPRDASASLDDRARSINCWKVFLNHRSALIQNMSRI